MRLRGVAAVAVTVCAFVVACGSSDPPQAAPSSAPPQQTTTAPPKRVAVDQPGPGDQQVTLDFGGRQRTYVVHAPPGYDGSVALPLVVAMHPWPGDAALIAETTGWNAKADKENFLVVYPEGYDRSYNALVCCGNEDDVGFIETVIARMTAEWKADPKRVYATGMSNGGDMAIKLAMELPATLAAIAPVSAGFIGPKIADPSYRPATPVSMITVIGGKDRYYAQFEDGIKAWRERLACAEAGAPTTLEKGITATASTCSDGSALSVYRVPDMGHSWPGPRQGSSSDPKAGIDATDLVWEFFKTRTT
jgi:polyhydroxybutyrate depolymerase